MPAKTYGADITAISSATLSNDVIVGTSAVINENCTASDAGIDTAVSSAVSDSQVARLSADTRSRRRYTQTAPAVMPSIATLIAKKAM